MVEVERVEAIKLVCLCRRAVLQCVTPPSLSLQYEVK
jgi:hypothetical protein